MWGVFLLIRSPLVTLSSFLGLACMPDKLPPRGSSHLLFSMPLTLFPGCLPDLSLASAGLCSQTHFSMRPFLYFLLCYFTLLFKMTPLPTLHSLFFPADFFFPIAFININNTIVYFLIHLFSVFPTRMQIHEGWVFIFIPCSTSSPCDSSCTQSSLNAYLLNEWLLYMLSLSF